MGSKVNLGSLGILQKRAGFVSFQRHTVLVIIMFEGIVEVCIICESICNEKASSGFIAIIMLEWNCTPNQNFIRLAYRLSY